MNITTFEFQLLMGLPPDLEYTFHNVLEKMNNEYNCKYDLGLYYRFSANELEELIQDWVKFIDNGLFSEEPMGFYECGVSWLKENIRTITEVSGKDCKTIRDSINYHYHKKEKEEINEVKKYLKKRLYREKNI